MRRLLLSLLIICLSGALPLANVVFAQTSTEDVDDIQAEIDAREAQIDVINQKIDEYREKINYYINQSESLANDIALIENQQALLELDLQATEAEIQTKELEITILQEAIKEQEAKISYQRDILEEMVFQLNKNDGVGFVEVLFGADDFNELFSAVEDLQSVSEDMNTALDETKETRQQLAENKLRQEDSLDQLVTLQNDLEVQSVQLEQTANAKETLITQAESSESEYRVLLSEVRQEQAAINQKILQLQQELEGKISSLDELGDATVFTWPTDGIITALFHDPSYPFRHLFEHGGLDIAVPTGTPIEAAAPGYVAWARTGRSYGNYVMIIHADGYATLYAHLSSMNVVADQFVSRGQVIGYSGSTGLSTGPHLHFEIRADGIPVDPLLFLQ